jgi:antitoxin (DNA-binding transcriptional repressor) of toxin-antitoxin stability system
VANASQPPGQSTELGPNHRFAKASETCFTDTVKTISIRDLRLRWPAAESALATERELIVTRDGKPVAKLVRFQDKTRKRKRFKPEEHKLRMHKLWGKTRLSLVQDLVITERQRE